MGFRPVVKGYAELDKNLKKAIKLTRQGLLPLLVLEVAEFVCDMAIDNAIAQGLVDKGILIGSIEAKLINQYAAKIVVGAPYGLAYEFGTTVEITPRQRQFFWARYMETEDEMWRALALSATYTIRARPYMRPALDQRARISRRAKETATRLIGSAL